MFGYWLNIVALSPSVRVSLRNVIRPTVTLGDSEIKGNASITPPSTHIVS